MLGYQYLELSVQGTLEQREPLPELLNFLINEVKQPFREPVELIRHFLLTIGHFLAPLQTIVLHYPDGARVPFHMLLFGD